MERPPLSTVLTSVLGAAVDNTHRTALLGAMSRNRFGPGEEERPGLAEVVPLATVIPRPRRAAEQAAATGPELDPTPAA